MDHIPSGVARTVGDRAGRFADLERPRHAAGRWTAEMVDDVLQEWVAAVGRCDPEALRVLAEIEADDELDELEWRRDAGAGEPGDAA